MITLTIDTSNDILGIAILKDGVLVGQKVTQVNQDHSSRLMPAIVELLSTLNIKQTDLNQIIVAKGPGSFTGIRIGVTIAKSLAWALDIPVIGVSSLKALAYQGALTNKLICSFFDARRDNVFVGIYQMIDNKLVTIEKDANVSFVDLDKKLKELNQPVILLSPHINKFRKLISENLNILSTIPADVYHITNPSHLYLAGLDEVQSDTHNLVPEYLRLSEAESNWLKNQGEEEK